MEGGIYLSLAYPILGNKYVTVGLIEERNYEVGVSFTRHKGNGMILEFSEWNYLMTFHERKMQQMMMCDENKKSVLVKRNFGKQFVQINDNKNRFVFNELEWTCFTSLIPLLNKYIVRLFYDQKHFKSYIEQVVSTASYVPPEFYFPSFFTEPKHSRLDQQLTFDRLYDELLMSGKVGEKVEIPVFTNDLLVTTASQSL